MPTGRGVRGIIAPPLTNQSICFFPRVEPAEVPLGEGRSEFRARMSPPRADNHVRKTTIQICMKLLCTTEYGSARNPKRCSAREPLKPNVRV
jgi:hypothetical protein